MDDKSRRNFLKIAGAAVLGGTGVTALASAPHGKKKKGRQWAMVVDMQRCLDGQANRCGQKCKLACHAAHNVPDMSEARFKIAAEDVKKREIKWIWLQGYHGAFPEQQHSHPRKKLVGASFPILCNHCENPTCVKICPTQATWKRKSDGIVMMDMHRCIGCRYCMVGCPYGSRSFNFFAPWPRNDDNMFDARHPAPPSRDYPTRSKGVVEKCNFCAELLVEAKMRGEKTYEPHCVNKCPVKALGFGDVSDKNSDLYKVLEARHTITRKPALGTGPQIYYIV